MITTNEPKELKVIKSTGTGNDMVKEKRGHTERLKDLINSVGIECLQFTNSHKEVETEEKEQLDKTTPGELPCSTS